MRDNDFESSNSGRLIKTIEGYSAFTPNPLPPALDTSVISDQVAETSSILGELRQAARKLKNPYIFITPLQRREALTTSAMEGTYTQIDLLIQAEQGLPAQATEDALEASNYVTALRWAIEQLKTLPISHRVIKNAHKRLLHGLSDQRGASKRPGEYKIHQNWIGGGKSITNARYVPPPPDMSQTCMDDLERYINAENKGHATKLIDLAIVHYQFEAIHPFADGNGRLGRMLVTLMAMDSALLGHPLLYISPTLENQKDDYIDHMHEVSTRGDWISWIKFFLRIVKEACEDTLSKINRLSDLQEDYHRRAREAGRSNKLQDIVDQLFERPYLTIPMVEERLAVTYVAAKNLVQQLVSVGILHEIGVLHQPNTRNPKLFSAKDVVDISGR